MVERRNALRTGWDWVRTGLTHEPRGHSGMFGAVLTPPIRTGSAYGLIFFDPVGYMDGCGHGTLCSIAVWRRMHGVVALPFSIDNPDDSVTRVLSVEGDDEHCAIELAMPPATVLADPLEAPGLSALRPALVRCGNTFLMVDAHAAGVTNLSDCTTSDLEAVARQMRALGRAAFAGRSGGGLEILLYEETTDSRRTFATFVLFNGTQVDRSPCGTGSAALTALLITRGMLRNGVVIRTVGRAGAYFEVEGRARAGSPSMIDVQLRGTAHITGVHQWIFSDADDLARGYLLA